MKKLLALLLIVPLALCSNALAFFEIDLGQLQSAFDLDAEEFVASIDALSETGNYTEHDPWQTDLFLGYGYKLRRYSASDAVDVGIIINDDRVYAILVSVNAELTADTSRQMGSDLGYELTRIVSALEGADYSYDAAMQLAQSIIIDGLGTALTNPRETCSVPALDGVFSTYASINPLNGYITVTQLYAPETYEF